MKDIQDRIKVIPEEEAKDTATIVIIKVTNQMLNLLKNKNKRLMKHCIILNMPKRRF